MFGVVQSADSATIFPRRFARVVALDSHHRETELIADANLFTAVASSPNARMVAVADPDHGVWVSDGSPQGTRLITHDTTTCPTAERLSWSGNSQRVAIAECIG